MTLPLEHPLFWLLAIVGVVLTGISKSGFAGGAGVVAVPMLALVISVPQATALMLPLLLVMDVRTIQYYRQHMSRSELKAIIPGAIVGITAGGLLMGSIADAVLQAVLGVVSMVFASWQSITPYFNRMRGAGLLWSSISGLTSTLIHAGGPPINIYLVGRQLPKLTWLATAGVFFGVMNVIKIIPYAWLGQWHRELLLVSLALVPAAWLGIKLGHLIQHRISEASFSRICRVLLLLSGLMLLAKAFYADA